MKIMKAICCFLAMIALVNGHARFIDPTPRSSNAGLSQFPCGNLVARNPVKSYPVNTQFEVEWEEVLPHEGYYKISYSRDNENSWVTLANNINSNGVNDYSTIVTAPSQSCSNCVLQMILITDQGNDYHSCSDISFVGSDPCDNISCLNGGTCNNGGCSCINGFTGQFCQVDSCNNVSCLNGGSCTNGECVCYGGYTGVECEVSPNICGNIDCKNGNCENGSCICESGYTGVFCESFEQTPRTQNGNGLIYAIIALICVLVILVISGGYLVYKSYQIKVKTQNRDRYRV